LIRHNFRSTVFCLKKYLYSSLSYEIKLFMFYYAIKGLSMLPQRATSSNWVAIYWTGKYQVISVISSDPGAHARFQYLIHIKSGPKHTINAGFSIMVYFDCSKNPILPSSTPSGHSTEEFMWFKRWQLFLKISPFKTLLQCGFNFRLFQHLEWAVFNAKQYS